MNIQFNPSFQSTSGLNIYRINQSVADQKQGTAEQTNIDIRLDTVLISPQGQNNNLIDMLMKQKMSIKERMESLVSSAAEDGLSMDSIRAQLEEYEKQLQDIDAQVAEAMAKEVQNQTEKMQTNRSNKPMTKEEIQQARMTSLIGLSNDIKQAETIESVKTKIDGQSGVLEAEIKLDKGRGGSVARKEQELAELESKSESLTSEIGARAAQISDEIRENSELTAERTGTDEFVQPSWAESLSFGVPKTNEESQFVEFTGDHVSEKAQELASLMTETPVGVEIDLDGMSMEQLANLCGGIGKQIDDALASGQISEQEYADLNEGLSAYTSFMTEKAETEKAMWAVLRQTSEAVRNKIENGASHEEVKNYAEQIRNSWTDKVSEFLKDNSYDRTVLDQMIAIIREGKNI